MSAGPSQQPDLQASWVVGSAALQELGADWDALADPGDPFMRREWLEPWLDAFGGECQPAVCVARRAERIVGLIPLLRKHGCLAAMSNVHTPSFRALASDDQVLAILGTAAADDRRPHVAIGPLAADDRATAILAEAVRSAGRLVTLEESYPSLVVDTTGSFDEYRRERLHSFREAERRTRKAEREHGLVIRAVETPPDRGVGFIEAGLLVESSGWKGREGTGILSHADTAQFYRTMARRFAERGELRLSGLWLDGRLAAFDLALAHQRCYWGLKTGYDESFRRIGPGSLLQHAVLKRCFELPIDRQEILAGNEPWKESVATGEWRQCTLRAFRPGPRGLAQHSWRRVRRRAGHALSPPLQKLRSALDSTPTSPRS